MRTVLGLVLLQLSALVGYLDFGIQTAIGRFLRSRRREVEIPIMAITS